MKTAAIICEFNPLHKGHERLIRYAKERADSVVCIMSGSFVQRGEPAIFDKFTRSRWALLAGADAVFELPCLYSLQSAEGFAYGAVFIANAIGADYLVFGAETEDLETLKRLAQPDDSQPGEFRAALRGALDAGLPYPAAHAEAVRAAYGGDGGFLLPNSTLAVEYIRAIERLGSAMEPVALLRPRPGISSSRVREGILSSALDPGVLPSYVYEDIPSLRPVRLGQMSDSILYKLRSLPESEYALFPDISEGLENRIRSAARSCSTLEGLLKEIKSKRYTMARIKRIVICALLGIRAEDISRAKGGAEYARLLALGQGTQSMMRELGGKSSLPIIGRASQLAACGSFSLEALATDVRALYEGRPAGLDFTTPVINI